MSSSRCVRWPISGRSRRPRLSRCFRSDWEISSRQRFCWP